MGERMQSRWYGSMAGRLGGETWGPWLLLEAKWQGQGRVRGSAELMEEGRRRRHRWGGDEEEGEWKKEVGVRRWRRGGGDASTTGLGREQRGRVGDAPRASPPTDGGCVSCGRGRGGGGGGVVKKKKGSRVGEEEDEAATTGSNGGGGRRA